jgi:hypothetical protein
LTLYFGSGSGIVVSGEGAAVVAGAVGLFDAALGAVVPGEAALVCAVARGLKPLPVVVTTGGGVTGIDVSIGGGVGGAGVTVVVKAGGGVVVNGGARVIAFVVETGRSDGGGCTSFKPT